MEARHRLTMSSLLGLAAVAAIVAPLASAADAEAAPLFEGPYATLLGRYVKEDSSSATDDGVGVTAGFGLRRELLAFEGRASYTSFDTGRGVGGSGNILVFPFTSLPGLYGLFGVGLENIHGYPGVDGTFNNATANTGLGYIFPLNFGSYQFGLRAEALYEYAKRNKRDRDQTPPTIDLPVASSFDNAILHIGLQLPFGSPPPPPPPAPPPPPVEVVPPAPIAPPPCKAPQPGERLSLAGCGTGDVMVLRGVNFDFDKSSLTPDAKTILDGVADELKAFPSIQVEIDGHTDAIGSDDYNQRLSEQRAASVVTYLAEHGIDAGRMSSKGFGESMPVADNGTDEGREQNRRVELKIVVGSVVPAAAATPDAAPADAPLDAATTPGPDAAPPEAAPALADPPSSQ